MVVKKVAFLRIVALAVTLAGTALQPVRAEDSATQHGGDGGICARSEFRVLIDVGHTATSPGADSARGVPEYDFNLKLADMIAQSLHEAGFDKTVRLITSGAKFPSLFERARRANNVQADLFISIHHDSVPDNLKEVWQYEGKKSYYSDRFSGTPSLFPMTMQIAPAAWPSATRSVRSCRSAVYTTRRTMRFR
jgi:N-acetylmuramoyl-L-alanine amidase